MSSPMAHLPMDVLPSCSLPAEVTVHVNGPDDALAPHAVYLVQAFNPDGSKKQRLWQIKAHYQGSRDQHAQPVGPYDREHGWRVCDVPRSRWRAKDANTYKIDACQNEGIARTGEITVKGVVDAARDRSAGKRKRRARGGEGSTNEQYSFCGEAFNGDQGVLDAISRHIAPSCAPMLDQPVCGGKVRFLGQLWPSFSEALHGLSMLSQGHREEHQTNSNNRNKRCKQVKREEFKKEDCALLAQAHAQAEARMKQAQAQHASEVWMLQQQLAQAQRNTSTSVKLHKEESGMSVKLEQMFFPQCEEQLPMSCEEPLMPPPPQALLPAGMSIACKEEEDLLLDQEFNSLLESHCFAC
eukprot:TRINITY_DN3784_c0_g1_i1.p1 TRINITY_DN3784_c0_g1~~TRINITY_DN3784_c0_g1_i1.p1  ORF type:complete len:354 (+),score=90.14 TRINITY_DN3784_c0_g1_i1:166-1227(+)